MRHLQHTRLTTTTAWIWVTAYLLAGSVLALVGALLWRTGHPLARPFMAGAAALLASAVLAVTNQIRSQPKYAHGDDRLRRTARRDLALLIPLVGILTVTAVFVAQRAALPVDQFFRTIEGRPHDMRSGSQVQMREGGPWLLQRCRRWRDRPCGRTAEYDTLPRWPHPNHVVVQYDLSGRMQGLTVDGVLMIDGKITHRSIVKRYWAGFGLIAVLTVLAALFAWLRAADMVRHPESARLAAIATPVWKSPQGVKACISTAWRSSRKAQTVRSLALSLSIVLATALSAAAQDITPPPAGSAVAMQPALMTAGEEKTYRLETLATSTIPDGTAPEHSQRIFRIEVVRADADGLILAYTQMSNVGSAFPKLAQALNGRAIQFEAAPDGHPLKVLGWSGQRAAIIGFLERNDGQSLVEAVSSLSEQGVIDNILADASLVAAVQSLEPMARPRMDDAPQTPAEGVRINGWREFQGSRAGDCTFVLRRVTELDPTAPAVVEAKIAERLETRAFVSMADGWVVELEETVRRQRGPDSETVTRKVARQGPKPGACELRAPGTN